MESNKKRKAENTAERALGKIKKTLIGNKCQMGTFTVTDTGGVFVECRKSRSRLKSGS